MEGETRETAETIDVTGMAEAVAREAVGLVVAERGRAATESATAAVARETVGSVVVARGRVAMESETEAVAREAVGLVVAERGRAAMESGMVVVVAKEMVGLEVVARAKGARGLVMVAVARARVRAGVVARGWAMVVWLAAGKSTDVPLPGTVRVSSGGFDGAVFWVASTESYRRCLTVVQKRVFEARGCCRRSLASHERRPPKMRLVK